MPKFELILRRFRMGAELLKVKSIRTQKKLNLGHKKLISGRWQFDSCRVVHA